ncbi:hypothetical protein KY284_030289 [Solanum tuberosum]|nr:hypothetical protein KY284_030289 [Solanum tuberosum]
MSHVKRKIVLTNETKIPKRPMTKTCRKKNENSTTTLLEELRSETISSSQVEPNFSQKEYEEREKEKNEVDDDGERAEEVEEEEGKKEVEKEEGNKKEVEEDKGKQKEVEEEEGKNKEVVEEEEEKINGVDEDKGKQKEVEEEEGNKNEVEEEEQEKNKVEDDDGIKTVITFHVHFQPNATDVNNNIALKLVEFSEDVEAFNNYNYELTVDYLLRPLSPKINNLFGFPWAFMAWAFEAIPHLRHQVTAEEEISSPRILRWLRAKTKIVKIPPDLYNPPHDVYIEEIFNLTGERHVRYPEYYDSTDRILDLNFYSNFKQRYDKMSEEAITVGGRSYTQLINEFEWNEDMINYVRGIRPYPGGMDWIGAKRIVAVMNLNKTHFVTFEILLHEGRMNVYDCQLMGIEHANGIMKHLPNKFLNEPWEFEGRLEPMVTNDTKAACGWPNAMNLGYWDSI